jgi:hypothetical protein
MGSASVEVEKWRFGGLADGSAVLGDGLPRTAEFEQAKPESVQKVGTLWIPATASFQKSDSFTKLPEAHAFMGSHDQEIGVLDPAPDRFVREIDCPSHLARAHGIADASQILLRKCLFRPIDKSGIAHGLALSRRLPLVRICPSGRYDIERNRCPVLF